MPSVRKGYRSKILMRVILTVIGVTSAFAACSEIHETMEETGKQNQLEPTQKKYAIRGSDGPGDASFSVGIVMTQLDVSNSANSRTFQCTAVALSPHWLLTAAHCIRIFQDGVSWRSRDVEVWRQTQSGNSNTELVYGGRMGFKLPSGWDPVNMPLKYDIGLIKLTEAAMNPSPHSWGRIYDGSRDDLWNYLAAENIVIGGWGQGNTTQTNCNLTSMVPRSGQLSISSLNAETIVGIQDQYENICVGDSGGPWWDKPTGSSYKLTWGINSRGDSLDECGNRCIADGDPAYAVYPGSWIDWIEDATSDARLPLDCKRYVSGDWYYQRCYE